VDQIINSKIDECHDHAKFNSKELLEKLKKIVQDNFDDIDDKTKYRLLVDIAEPLHVFLLDGNKLPKSLQYLVH
jgi:hypothetical protein